MGTDIYAFVEAQEIWSDQHYWKKAEIQLERDYYLFGLMAGERDYEKPLFEPKGLPANVNNLIRVACSGHNASWLNAGEFEAVLACYGLSNSSIPETYGATLKFMQGLNPSARLVFWFDG